MAGARELGMTGGRRARAGIGSRQLQLQLRLRSLGMTLYFFVRLFGKENMPWSTTKLIYIGAGWLCFALGAAGIVLPLVPTTPLWLLAAFFFFKGSERLHRWLCNKPGIGPVIKEWEAAGIVRRKAKVSATVAIVILFSISLIVAHVSLWLKALVTLTGIGVLIFIWTRPEGN